MLAEFLTTSLGKMHIFLLLCLRVNAQDERSERLSTYSIDFLLLCLELTFRVRTVRSFQRIPSTDRRCAL